MAKVEGVQELNGQLSKLADANRESPEVVVGYTQSYAVHVHEDLEAHHRNGQAKFLEQPARELAPVLVDIVISAMRRGVSLGQSLLLAGLRLQRESQLLCPVDTGALRNSAFTRQEV